MKLEIVNSYAVIWYAFLGLGHYLRRAVLPIHIWQTLFPGICRKTLRWLSDLSVFHVSELVHYWRPLSKTEHTLVR